MTVLVEEREPHARQRRGAPLGRRRGYLVTTDARPGSTGLPILTGIGTSARDRRQSESLQAGLALLHVLERTSGRLAARLRGGPGAPPAPCSTWWGSRSGWGGRLGRPPGAADGVLGARRPRRARGVHRPPVPGRVVLYASAFRDAHRPVRVAGASVAAGRGDHHLPIPAAPAWSDADGAQDAEHHHGARRGDDEGLCRHR